MSRPLVAVAATRLPPGRIASWTDGAEAAQWAYLDGLRRAGVQPALVAPARDEAPADVLARFDGLVLTGGADIDPGAYGQASHSSVYGVDVERDRRELELSRHAVAAGVPLLAICRGIQVLNVALGGSLVQHLPDLGLPVAHGVPVGTGEPATHAVEVTAGSRLAELLDGGTTAARCVSIHHQAIDALGEGLVVSARSADGVIEAVETPAGTPWCLAVQWHPERSADTDRQQQAVFDGFARALA